MFEDITDFVRNGFPYFLVLFLLSAPTLADSNFNIQRMVRNFPIKFPINLIKNPFRSNTTLIKYHTAVRRRQQSTWKQSH